MSTPGNDDPTVPVGAPRAAMMAALREGKGGLDSVARAGRACVELLPVDGVSILMTSGTEPGEVLFASDEVIDRVESLQFTLGEGPSFEAVGTHRPVLVPDIATDPASAWPVFATEISQLPVGAIFAFPLQSGAIGLGTIDMYRRRPGLLTHDELVIALEIVDVMTQILLGLAGTGRDADIGYVWLEDLPHHHAVVHQATGMLIAGHAVSARTALSRLRAHAFVTGRLIEDVARDITTRRLRIEEIQT